MQTMIGIWAVEFYALLVKPEGKERIYTLIPRMHDIIITSDIPSEWEKRRESHHPTGSLPVPLQSFTACFCSSVGNFANISLSLSIGAAINPANVSKGGLSGAPG